jgi:hypothetical protein
MQICCGIEERHAITAKMIAAYPECHLEYVEGKTYTAIY